MASHLPLPLEIKNGKVVGSTSTYPPRLLIYYAGRRTVWLACTKLCTLFVAAFAAGVIAPGWYWEIVDPGAAEQAAAAKNEGEKDVVVVKGEKEKEGREEKPRSELVSFKLPMWVPGVGDAEITLPAKTAGILAAVAIAVMGSIPFLMMQYFSPPYVTHLHLHLPTHARHSPPYLLRFLNHLPPATPLSLITIRLFGQPTQHTLPVGQLRRESRRAGCANLVWRGWDQKRGKVVEKLFYVDERGSPARAGDGELGAVGAVLAKVVKWTEKGGPEGEALEEGERKKTRKMK